MKWRESPKRRNTRKIQCFRMVGVVRGLIGIPSTRILVSPRHWTGPANGEIVVRESVLLISLGFGAVAAASESLETDGRTRAAEAQGVGSKAGKGGGGANPGKTNRIKPNQAFQMARPPHEPRRKGTLTPRTEQHEGWTALRGLPSPA